MDLYKTLGVHAWLLLLHLGVSVELFAQLKRAPSWVSQVPVTENAFFGLGISSINENAEYRTYARKVALREILEKIQISINSESELKVKYKNDNIEYLLDEKIAVESSGFLSGYQKVDEWLDKRSKTYYVLFRLNESTYRDNRRTYFQKVDEILHLIRSEADELFTKGEIVRGITKLSDGIIRIENEMNKLIEPEYLANLQKNRLSALYELEEQLSRISFKISSNYQFDVTDAEPLVISNFLVDRVTGTPVRNLKTSLKVLKGDVFNYEFKLTNGGRDLNIYGAYPTHQTIEIQLVADVNLPNRIKVSIDPAILKQLVSNRISIPFKPYSIAFESNERIEANPNEKQPFTALLQSITQDLNLAEVSTSEAFYQFQINTQNKILNRQRGIYTAQYTASIKVFRINDNQEVYEYKIPAKRAKAPKKTVALNLAAKQLKSNSEAFLQSFITFLCTKRPHFVE